MTLSGMKKLVRTEKCREKKEKKAREKERREKLQGEEEGGREREIRLAKENEKRETEKEKRWKGDCPSGVNKFPSYLSLSFLHGSLSFFFDFSSGGVFLSFLLTPRLLHLAD